MKTEFSTELGLCGTYEDLLTKCERALEAWSARSDQIRKIHLAGVEVGGEMLRLQARFAKAYAALRRHVERCEQCRRLMRRVNLHRFGQSNAA